MNTAVYFLRAKQVGLSLDEMEQIDIGFVFDLMIEQSNDYEKYPEKATQADINRLLG